MDKQTRKQLTQLNRMHRYICDALEQQRTDNLELRRRITQLETKLGLQWEPETIADGHYITVRVVNIKDLPRVTRGQR